MPAPGASYQSMLYTLGQAGGPALQQYIKQTYYTGPGGRINSAAFTPQAIGDVANRAAAMGVDVKNLFKNDYSGLKIMAAIVAAGFGGAALISALSGAPVATAAATGAYGPTLQQLGATPAEIAAANAGVGGIEPVATLADASLGASAAPADVGAGSLAAADAGTPGYIGTAVGNTATEASTAPLASADPLAAVTNPTVSSPSFVNVPYGPTLTQMGATPQQIAAITGTGAAGAAGGFTNFLKSLAGPLVSGGLGLAGAAIQSSAANKAAQIAAQTAANALGVNAQEYNTNVAQNTAQANQKLAAYNQTLANLAPYRAIGTSALNFLGQGLPGFAQQQVPTVTPIAPLATPTPLTVPGQTIPPTSFQPGATVGERRYVNGQLAQWDGTGWKAV